MKKQDFLKFRICLICENCTWWLENGSFPLSWCWNSRKFSNWFELVAWGSQNFYNVANVLKILGSSNRKWRQCLLGSCKRKYIFSNIWIWISAGRIIFRISYVNVYWEVLFIKSCYGGLYFDLNLQSDQNY